ncbi:MAG: WecB/TagA/CpsF family glycosyltransferase [Endomicrobiia bacterium]
MYIFFIKGKEVLFGNLNELLNKIEKLIINSFNNPSQIITLNSLIYFQTKIDPWSFKAFKNSKLVICDSFGVAFVCSVFSLKILRHQPGIELVEEIAKISRTKNYSIYLFGSKKEIVKQASMNLIDKYQANIVGCHHGYIFSDISEEKKVIEDINKKKPDILLVGLPTELQEKWIYNNLNKLDCKVVIGVGGSFDVISGKLKRAPKFFRILGLEWFFRLAQQPWRITRIIKLPLAFIVLFYDCFKSKLKNYE